MEKKIFRKSVEFITCGDKFTFNKPIYAPNINKSEKFIIPHELTLNRLICDNIKNKEIIELKNKIDKIKIPKIPEFKMPTKFKKLEINELKNTSIESKKIVCSGDLYQRGSVVLANLNKEVLNPDDLIHKKIIKIDRDFKLCDNNKLIFKLPKVKGLFFRLHIQNTSTKDINIKDGKNFKVIGKNKIKANSINEYYLNTMKTRSELIILNEYKL